MVDETLNTVRCCVSPCSVPMCPQVSVQSRSSVPSNDNCLMGTNKKHTKNIFQERVFVYCTEPLSKRVLFGVQ